MIEFEWDTAKALANERKHGVSFGEASTVFGDPAAATFPDPDHSRDEEREITVGLSGRGRLVIVSHTQRDDRVRIISVRKATQAERKLYETH